MSDVVFAHDGVIVQFAGDAIEAFWNAPMDQPDHARRACQAALDMSLALGAIRPEFEARLALSLGEPPITDWTYDLRLWRHLGPAPEETGP